jgi:hypothetical protein
MNSASFTQAACMATLLAAVPAGAVPAGAARPALGRSSELKLAEASE